MMSKQSCPNCGEKMGGGGFQSWQIIVSIVFFPIGILALLAKRKPKECSNCTQATDDANQRFSRRWALLAGAIAMSRNAIYLWYASLRVPPGDSSDWGEAYEPSTWASLASIHSHFFDFGPNAVQEIRFHAAAAGFIALIFCAFFLKRLRSSLSNKSNWSTKGDLNAHRKMNGEQTGADGIASQVKESLRGNGRGPVAEGEAWFTNLPLYVASFVGSFLVTNFMFWGFLVTKSVIYMFCGATILRLIPFIIIGFWAFWALWALWSLCALCVLWLK